MLAPRPLWLCEDPAVIGRAVLHHGAAAGHRRGPQGRARSGARARPRAARARARRESRAAAYDQAAASRPRFPADDARARQHRALPRAISTRSTTAHPVLEWGLRWCELQRAAARGDHFHPSRLPHRQLPRSRRASRRRPRLGVLPRSAIRSKTSAGSSRNAGASARTTTRSAASPTPRIFCSEYEARSGRTVDAAGARLLAGHGAPALGGDRAAAARAPSLRRRAFARARADRPYPERARASKSSCSPRSDAHEQSARRARTCSRSRAMRCSRSCGRSCRTARATPRLMIANAMAIAAREDRSGRSAGARRARAPATRCTANAPRDARRRGARCRGARERYDAAACGRHPRRALRSARSGGARLDHLRETRGGEAAHFEPEERSKRDSIAR